MNTLSLGYRLLAVLCVVGSIDVCLAQGSLTPPGAPSATMKTLEQVEPRIDVATLVGYGNVAHSIIAPGSYYLSGDMMVTNDFGIFIESSDVTLDLNGFRITRSSGSEDGIRIDNASRVTVRNGVISQFSTAVNVVDGSNCTLENLVVGSSNGDGIVGGETARIRNCTVKNCAGTGITAGIDSMVEGCIAAVSLGAAGILTDQGSSIVSCTAINNSGRGIYGKDNTTIRDCIASGQGGTGIDAGIGSSITGCTAYENQGGGIIAGAGCTIRGSTAHNNQLFGIGTGPGAVLSECSARENQGAYGISAGFGSILNNCSAYGNIGTDNSSYGIHAQDGSSIIQCTALNNSHTNGSSTASQGIGIGTSSQVTVKDCTVTNNKGDGIRVDWNCIVSGNKSTSNGSSGDGAGIRVAGNNRVVGNHVSSNDRGIEVTSSQNTLGGNTAVDNSTSNYVIAAGNSYGDIVDNTGDAGSAPAHSGNGAAGGTISANNNPWANFSQ